MVDSDAYRVCNALFSLIHMAIADAGTWLPSWLVEVLLPLAAEWSVGVMASGQGVDFSLGVHSRIDGGRIGGVINFDEQRIVGSVLVTRHGSSGVRGQWVTTVFHHKSFCGFDEYQGFGEALVAGCERCHARGSLSQHRDIAVGLYLQPDGGLFTDGHIDHYIVMNDDTFLNI